MLFVVQLFAMKSYRCLHSWPSQKKIAEKSKQKQKFTHKTPSDLVALCLFNFFSILVCIPPILLCSDLFVHCWCYLLLCACFLLCFRLNKMCHFVFWLGDGIIKQFFFCSFHSKLHASWFWNNPELPLYKKSFWPFIYAFGNLLAMEHALWCSAPHVNINLNT